MKHIFTHLTSAILAFFLLWSLPCLAAEIDYADLFDRTAHADGAYSEGCASEIGAAFDADPQSLLEALAPETEEMQNRILSELLYEKATEAQQKDVVAVVEGLLKQEDHSPEETALFKNLIAYATAWHVGDSFPPEPTEPPTEAPTQAPTEPASREKGPAEGCWYFLLIPVLLLGGYFLFRKRKNP